MKKINLGKVGSAFAPLPRSLLIYLLYFVFAETIISGGRYERDIYLWAIIFLLVGALEVMFTLKNKMADIKDAIKTGLWFALPIVALDYLIVNLLLEKNSLSIFKNWENITLYAITLVLPIIVLMLQRSKRENHQVDELLTNQKPTL